MRVDEIKPKKGSHTVVEERGGIVEGYHHAHVAVVNKQGKILFSSGDPTLFTFSRSCIKPIQAVPILSTGTADHFDFSKEEIAIICGSHSGQDEHVKVVRSILDKIGLEEEHLLCGGHSPFHKDTARKMCGNHTRIHDNCSGKHAGVLAMCKHKDWPLRSYTDPAHPAQKIILKTIAEIGEMDIGEIALAPDGCSIPNFAFPMDRLAYMFARLGDPEGSHFGEPLMRIKEAILAHPHMISGTGRFDETLMDQKPGEIISKAGAMGLQAVALRHEGEWLGIAAKIEDGNYPAVTRLTYTLLEELGLDLVEDKFNPKLIKTRSEEVVGSFKVFGTLGNVAR